MIKRMISLFMAAGILFHMMPGGPDGTLYGVPSGFAVRETVLTDAAESVPEVETEEGEYYRSSIAKRGQQYVEGSAGLTPVAQNGSPSAVQNAEGAGLSGSGRYTLMVYMIGSDLESGHGNATIDISEMQAAGVDPQKANILIYTGGSQLWSGDIPCDRNCVIDLSRDADSRIVAETDGNCDTGTAEALSEFVNFCTESYPAEHYALIMWDHGAGPVWGFGNDELFDGDSLLLPEMQRAMDSTAFGQGEKKLDFVGFDACLMACAENMKVWSRYADYYVASEEFEQQNGWDYSFLSVLNETEDPVEITGRIIWEFQAFYEGAVREDYHPQVTLSCIDLHRIADCIEASDQLFEAILDDMGKDTYPQLRRARNAATEFGNAGGNRGKTSALDIMDLGSFAGRMGEKYPEEAEKLIRSIDESVVWEYSNIEDTCGVSVYYPAYNKEQFQQVWDSYREYALSGGAADLIEAVSAYWASGVSREWTFAPAEESDGEYRIPLSGEQLSEMSEAYYSVLQRMEDGAYRILLSHVSLEPDEDGILHVPSDPLAVCIVCGEYEALPWPAEQIGMSGSMTKYRTTDTYLFHTFSEESEAYSQEERAVSISFFADRNGRVSIENVSAENEDILKAGKNDIAVSDWSGIYTDGNCRGAIGNEPGKLLSAAFWPLTGTDDRQIAAVDTRLGFAMRPVSELYGDFVIQAVLEDCNGELYGSACLQTADSSLFTIETVHTEKGELQLARYGDHSELFSYSGSDTEIVIPETVTVIGSSAFMDHGSIQKVQFPAGLKYIGAAAFKGCTGLVSILIPEGVEHVGSFAFAGCYEPQECVLPGSLEYIGEGVLYMTWPAALRMSGDSTACCVHDGVLYSADYETAIASIRNPGGEDTALSIRTETRRIGFGAFALSGITTVALPEGLEEIGHYAFYNCSGLQQMPVLPDSVIRLGCKAFGANESIIRGRSRMQGSGNSAPAVIGIGPTVETIGRQAFALFPMRSFTADSGNPYFSTLDGTLTNKAEDTALFLAVRDPREIVIPEGIANLNWDVLENVSTAVIGMQSQERAGTGTVVAVYVPESVIRFSGQEPERNSFLSDEAGVSYQFHCDPDTEAYRLVTEHDFSWSGETDLDYTEYEEDGCTYRLYADHAVLTRYDGGREEFEIPDTIQSLPVTRIGDGRDSIMEDTDTTAFRTVVIPDTVEEIAAFAFFGISISSGDGVLELPAGLKVLGDEALESITVTSIPEGIEYIGKCAVGGLKDRALAVGPSLRYAAYDAFENCRDFSQFMQKGNNAYYSVCDGALYSADGTELVAVPSARTGSFDVPEGTIQIGPGAFWASRLDTVQLPDSLAVVGEGAFAASSIEEVRFGNGLQEVGEVAFLYCPMLWKVTFEKGPETIGDYAFYFCKALSSLQLGEGTRYIGEAAFGSCAIGRLQLPDSLIRVGKGAFRNNPLTSLRIGRNLREFGEGAFSGSRTDEVFRLSVSEENMHLSQHGSSLLDRTGSLLLWAVPDTEGKVVIPDTVMGIADYACGSNYGIREIREVRIPDSVEYISALAFAPGQYSEITVHCSKGSFAERYISRRFASISLVVD